jgi:hypothetical protein
MVNEALGSMSYSERMVIAEARFTELEAKLINSDLKLKTFYENVPQRYRRLWLEVNFGERSSISKAIKLKCLDCSCWSQEQVKLCETKQCGLYKVRPYK